MLESLVREGAGGRWVLVTASLHKISAGDGYEYLTKQVAAFDDTNLGRQKLAEYYAEKGESPGRWLGKGLEGLGEFGDCFAVAVGSVVREDQMRALFGSGRHPEADAIEKQALEAGLKPEKALKASQLGRVFKDGTSGQFHDLLRRAYTAWNEEHGRRRGARIPDEVRAGIRTVLAEKTFVKRYGRKPLSRQELDGHLKQELRGDGGRSCAGFDVTFSPVKSVSALWAIAGREVAGVIEQAQDEAVQDAVAWLEQQAAYTRRGVRGARQVETKGLLAAQFVHRDSRAGDPDLHTHVAISNKVQDAADGAWLALDGRVIYQLMVAASERYNSSMERILTDKLGVGFRVRESDSGRRPIREIDGIPQELIEAWSTRRDAITARQEELVAAFEQRHLRPPTPVETLALAQQATLETREAKHEPRSLAEQRATWRSQAAEILGGESLVDDMAVGVLNRRTRTRKVDTVLVDRVAERVVGALEERRATWQIQHVTAEVERQVRGLNVAPGQHHDLVARVIDAVVEQQSIPVVTDPEAAIEVPAELRRSDGASMYERVHQLRYTSRRILEAEEFIRETARSQDGATVGEEAVTVALLESVANGVELNPQQTRLVREFATSGSRVQLALAPAGTGKTTAMRVLARAWENGGGTVIAAAPTHVAVDGLQTAMDAPGGTIASLTAALTHGTALPAWAENINAGSLVVVDEAGMAGTFELAELISFATSRGASIRLIGDHQQLAAVAAGGVLRDIAADETVATVTLDEVMRFVDPDEAAASLSLREGNTDALGYYLDHDRIHTVADDVASEVITAAWQADIDRGWETVMITTTNEDATRLNRLARQHLITTGVVDGDQASVALRDGNHASTGDIIVTRTNDRNLTVSATDYVKNRQRWRVIHVNDDGSLQVQGTEHGLATTLPARYVTESCELGYAGTSHSAQGITVDSTHTLITGVESRQNLYVAMSRGRHENHTWVTTGAAEESGIFMETLEPPTPVEVLEALFSRDGQAVSATTQTRLAEDPQFLLQHHATIWQDSIASGLAAVAGEETCARIDEHIEERIPGAQDMRGYAELRTQMLALELTSRDACSIFDVALASRPMGDARNPVAVMTWRLAKNHIDLRGGGPLPSLWHIPDPVAGLLPPEWQEYLQHRHDLVTETATRMRDLVTEWLNQPETAPAWSRPYLDAPDLVSDMALFRASVGVPDSDLTPLGPKAQFVNERQWQYQLRDRAAHHTGTHTNRWQLPQAVINDPYWPVLHARLNARAQAGINVENNLHEALQQGPLPTEHPAAALWYRLRNPDHVVQQDPDWVKILAEHVPGDVVDQARVLPEWTQLVVAINAAIEEGHDPRVLVATAASLIPADIEAEGLAPLLTQRIHDVLEPPEPNPVDALHDPETGVDFQSLPAEHSGPAVDEGVDDPVPEPDNEAIDHLHNPETNLDFTTLPSTRPHQGHEETVPEAEPGGSDQPPVRTSHPTQVEEGTSRERIIALHQVAADFYRSHYTGSGAATYMTNRLGTDLTDQEGVIVGYAPPRNVLLRHLRQQGATDQELLDAGLVKWGRGQQLIDVFRDRLILGIHDRGGDLVGFVGRAAPGAGPQVPKYINTPTTRVFHKGDVLFGLAEYQHLVDDGAELVRVEGPLDALAITLATEGKAVGIAPLGTALTQSQANQIATHTRTVWEATDSDTAGMKAAVKDFERYTAAGITAREFPLIPPTDDPRPVKDPAELFQRPGGAARLQAPLALGESAPTLAGRLITRLVDARTDQLADHDANATVAVARQAATLIAALPHDQWPEHIHHATACITDAEHRSDQTEWIRELVTRETHEAAARQQRPAAVNNPHHTPTVRTHSTPGEAIQQAQHVLDRVKNRPGAATRIQPELAATPEPSVPVKAAALKKTPTAASKTQPAAPAQASRQPSKQVDALRDRHVEATITASRIKRRLRDLTDRAVTAPKRQRLTRRIAAARKQQKALHTTALQPGQNIIDRIHAAQRLDAEIQELTTQLRTWNLPKAERTQVLAQQQAHAAAIARIDHQIQRITQANKGGPTINTLREIATLTQRKQQLQKNKELRENKEKTRPEPARNRRQDRGRDL